MGRSFLFGAEENFYPISAKEQGRVHQFGAKIFPGMFMEYALNAGRSWAGDLLVAHAEDLKTVPPSEIHVKRIKSKEMDIQKKRQ